MIPSYLISSLAVAADTQINNVLRTGATNAGQSVPTGEVGFVAAFVLGAVPAIAAAWRPILQPAGFSISMTGVFCHQTPQASFLDPAGVPCQCELADLLVVAEDLTSGAPSGRWATLVQAKMAARTGGQALTSTGDLIQLDLLTRWPPFTLPSNFSPGSRDFSTCNHAGVPLDSGRYGLIDRQPTPAWHQQAPASRMPPGGDQVGTFLARMLETGQVGYGREATGLSDDWSRTVDELMKVTFGLAFTYAAGFGSYQPKRGKTAVAFVIDTDDFRNAGGLWFREAPPSDGHPENLENSPPGEGINLLRIGVARKSDRDRD